MLFYYYSKNIIRINLKHFTILIIKIVIFNSQCNFLIFGLILSKVLILYRHFKLLNIYGDDKNIWIVSTNVINNLKTLDKNT